MAITDCVRQHEQVHVDHINKVNPRVCRNKGSEGFMVDFRNAVDRAYSEVQGTQSEIKCLEDKLKNASCECIAAINFRLNTARNQFYKNNIIFNGASAEDQEKSWRKLH